jgi:hypothetical protein
MCDKRLAAALANLLFFLQVDVAVEKAEEAVEKPVVKVRHPHSF